MSETKVQPADDPMVAHCKQRNAELGTKARDLEAEAATLRAERDELREAVVSLIDVCERELSTRKCALSSLRALNEARAKIAALKGES